MAIALVRAGSPYPHAIQAKTFLRVDSPCYHTYQLLFEVGVVLLIETGDSSLGEVQIDLN